MNGALGGLAADHVQGGINVGEADHVSGNLPDAIVASASSTAW